MILKSFRLKCSIPLEIITEQVLAPRYQFQNSHYYHVAGIQNEKLSQSSHLQLGFHVDNKTQSCDLPLLCSVSEHPGQMPVL